MYTSSIPKWLQIHTFYNRLDESSCTMIDAASRGLLNGKTLDEEFQLIETVVANNYLIPRNICVEERSYGS